MQTITNLFYYIWQLFYPCSLHAEIKEPVHSESEPRKKKRGGMAWMKAADASMCGRQSVHSIDRWTYRLGVEVEEGRAEVLGALAGDVGGARPVVGQRDVVERRHSRQGSRRLGRGRGRRGETGEGPPHQTPSPQLHHRHSRLVNQFPCFSPFVKLCVN